MLCGVVESQSWSLGVGEGPGIQGPLEALGKRGQYTQRAYSASFLITFSPHTDYCLSCELFQRPGGVGGRAWAWPDYTVAQSFCILMFVRLGSRPSPVSWDLSFWEQGRFRRQRPRVGSRLLDMLGSSKPPPPPSFLWKVKPYSPTAGESPTAFPGDNDCFKGSFCKEAKEKA